MKKIEDLLVGAPYLGDMQHTDWSSYTVAAQASEGLAWVSVQAVGEPAANVPKPDFERLGVANSETVVQVFGLHPDMESCSDYLVAGLGVVWS